MKLNVTELISKSNIIGLVQYVGVCHFLCLVHF
jgi:hypothetical protein